MRARAWVGGGGSAGVANGTVARAAVARGSHYLLPPPISHVIVALVAAARRRALGCAARAGKYMVTVEDGAYTWPHRSTFLLGRRHSQEKRKHVKDVTGKAVLDDFYGLAEKDGGEGFEKLKSSYPYKVRARRRIPPSGRGLESLALPCGSAPRAGSRAAASSGSIPTARDRPKLRA